MKDHHSPLVSSVDYSTVTHRHQQLTSLVELTVRFLLLVLLTFPPVAGRGLLPGDRPVSIISCFRALRTFLLIGDRTQPW